MSDDVMCGFCHTAWDIICGNLRSDTPLFNWIDNCREGGCDPSIWDYIDKNGNLDPNEPPPEHVPGMPRTDLHRSRRPGPYRKEKPRRRAKETVSASAAGDGWSSDW